MVFAVLSTFYILSTFSHILFAHPVLLVLILFVYPFVRPPPHPSVHPVALSSYISSRISSHILILALHLPFAFSPSVCPAFLHTVLHILLILHILCAPLAHAFARSLFFTSLSHMIFTLMIVSLCWAASAHHNDSQDFLR